MLFSQEAFIWLIGFNIFNFFAYLESVLYSLLFQSYLKIQNKWYDNCWISTETRWKLVYYIIPQWLDLIKLGLKLEII